MKTREFTTTIIRADENMYLTQSAEVSIEKRIVCSEIALGCNSTPEEWKEITKGEADEINAAKEAYRKEQEAKREAERKAQLENQIAE